MRWISTLLGCIFLAATPAFSAAESRPGSAEPKRPNILVIMTDEHNAAVMGCAGDRLARTPNLDSLTSRGVLFGAHYCASPICVPSRQSFTTGKYVSHHNVWGNTVGVPEGTPSLPRILNAAGYESFLDGKMHYKGGASHGFQILDEKSGLAKSSKSKVVAVEDGADEKASQTGGKKIRAHQRPPAGEFRDNKDELGEEFKPLGEENMDSFVDVGRRNGAITFLQHRKPGGKPFFLLVGFIAPHYPLVAPPQYLEHFKDRIPMPEIPQGYLDALPLNYQHLRNDRKLEHVPDQTVKLAREAYYARVEWTDQQIGMVLDALKASPFADNTVVIYTSDHGENMGEHGLWWKNCMYDTAARVPLIVSWPARWKGGQHRDGACGALDIVQTIAGLAGAKTPADWSGTSMLAWLDNGASAWKDQAVSEYYSGYVASGMAMIRQGDWKYVYHTRADEKHGPQRELYCLKTDPKELSNLAADPAQEQRLAAMHSALAKELGEDPEQAEARYRAGAIPGAPHGANPKAF